jgi:CRP-like cAMP-binding protein
MKKSDVDAEFRIRMFKGAPLFAAAGPDDLAELARAAKSVAVQAGRPLLKAEQDGAQVFVLQSGVAAELRVEPGEANELAVALLGPGDIAGLVSVFLPKSERGEAAEPAGAARRIEALSNLQALALSGPDFLRICRRNPDLMASVAARLAAHNATLAGVYARATGRSLETRLAGFFAELARLTTVEDWNPVANIGRLSQSAIATMLGVSREHVNRTLAMWERSGLIFQDKRGEIFVLNPKRLGRLADIGAERAGGDRDADWLWEIDAHLDRGLNQTALHLALEAARRAPKELRYMHRAVLATARMGAISEALALLDKHKLGRDLADEELACLRPRLLRDLAFAAGDEAPDARHLAQSARDYERVFEKTRGFYPGINAAAGYALAGETEKAGAIARSVWKILQERSDEDSEAEESYWRRTTLAECKLLEGDKIAAANLFEAASDASDATPGKKATTRKQLFRLAPHVRVDLDWIDRAAPQEAVAYFCGPIAREASPAAELPFQQLADDVDAFLAEHRIGWAYGALAAGADIIIAEKLIRSGVELNIYLPLAPQEFLKSSVIIGGEQWRDRFIACMRSASIIDWNRRSKTPANASYRLASETAMGKAVRHANQLATRAVGFFAAPAGRDASNSLSAANADLWRSRGFEATSSISKWPSPPLGLIEKNAAEAELLFALVILAESARLPKSLTTAGDIRIRDVEGGIDVLLFRALNDAVAAAEPLMRGEAAGEWSAWLDAGVFTSKTLEKGRAAAGQQLVTAACRPQTESGKVYASESFASVAQMISDRPVKFDYIGFVPTREKLDPCAMYLATI